MDLNSYIDHTLLKPDCTIKDIEQLCEESRAHHFAAVCVPPYFVKQADTALQQSPVRIATVIGFPMGYASTPSKVEEIKRAIEEGADEIDAVINLCAVKSEQWNYVNNDISSMVTAVHLKGKQIKIILETSLLSDAEIRRLAEICKVAEADYVKTSTGFNGGATLEAVRLLQEALDGHSKIKASGGIRTRWDAEQFIKAGAKRIGTSSGLSIVR
jgi:deoxyribose-phosphate aldolase